MSDGRQTSGAAYTVLLAFALACAAAPLPAPAAGARGAPDPSQPASVSAAPSLLPDGRTAAAPLSAVQPAGAQPGAAGLQAGDAFVDFGLPQLERASGQLGASIWLSDFVGPRAPETQRRVVLLNFFAIWCGPCFDELRVLDEWQRTYAERGLQVLSVNFRSPGEEVDEVLRETQQRVPPTLAFPLLFERHTKRNQSLYLGDTVVLPANLLLDRDGRVLLRLQGATPEKLESLRGEIERHLSGSPVPAASDAGSTP